MRKYTWIASIFILMAASLFLYTVRASRAADDGLIQVAPSECPSTGCAAGQRLNFSIQFSVSPATQQPNTQVCIYAPADGQSDGDGPWANFKSGWISDTGLISGESYVEGQQSSLCMGNLDAGDEFLIGAYTELPSDTVDQLEFAGHIHQDADINGYIKVKVIEVSAGSGIWEETARFSLPITVAERSETVYVASTPADCDDYTPCFVNSEDDLEAGLGTGLHDAVVAVDTGDEIRILKVYPIKDHTIAIDKDVVIRGHENAMLTYIGTECSQPMLKFTSGGTLSELTINDGNCFNPSRNLVEVDSSAHVAIENNTLVFGDHGVYVHDNTTDVIVAFNHIVNNDRYAVYRDAGKNTGQVKVYANNIINNRTGSQVNCNGQGTANHNFWGEGQAATENATDCAVTNGKRLGAAIRLATTQPGVQAQRLPVTTAMSYAFDGEIGAQRSAGKDYEVIIVNHGQGAASNIPFYQMGAGNTQPCSNFYDVFLADDAVALDLTLALRYDLNSQCISKIESSEYCGGTDSANYPLLWYDPATFATDGWDRTGQSPQGPGAGGVSGQDTSCNLAQKEIRVIIDNTGRPSISSDLNFTPFVVGLPVVDGITLSQFTAQFDGSRVHLKWITTSEVNVKGYYLLRADSKDGTYTRVSNLINAIGDAHIGGIYQYVDDTITFSRSYFYKIEVIDINGNPISTHGPVSIFTATATPTVTQTFTPTLSPTITMTYTRTPTRTPYLSPTPWYQYRTPTPYYRPRTATPVTRPTQVRTFGPTPEGTDTDPFLPTDESYPSEGYPFPVTEQPGEWESTQPSEGYPVPETPGPSDLTPTPEGDNGPDDLDEVTPTPGADAEEALPIENIRWVFILVGVAGGLSLIGAISVILAGTRFS